MKTIHNNEINITIAPSFDKFDEEGNFIGTFTIVKIQSRLWEKPLMTRIESLKGDFTLEEVVESLPRRLEEHLRERKSPVTFFKNEGNE